MTITPASIKTFAQELSAVADDEVQRSIDQAERRTNRVQWGVSKADDGITYLVCHMLTLAQRIKITGAQARGPLTAQTAGPVSRSFAAPVAPWSQAWFASTTYGQAYVELRSTIVADRTCA